MPQIFHRSTNAVARITIFGGIFLLAALVWAADLWTKSSYMTGQTVTINQPAKIVAGFRIGRWEAGFHSFRDADVCVAIGYNPMVSSYGPIGGLQGTNPFVAMRRARSGG